MNSMTGLGQRFAYALGFPGQVTVRKLIDDLVELAAGIRFAVDPIETSPVVEENGVEKPGVGVLLQNGLSVDRPAVVFLFVVKVGHLRNGISDPSAFRIIFIDSLVGPKRLLEITLSLAFARLQGHLLVTFRNAELPFPSKLAVLDRGQASEQGDRGLEVSLSLATLACCRMASSTNGLSGNSFCKRRLIAAAAP